MLPRAADQYENAVACRARGVARLVLPADMDVDSLRQGLATVLSEPSCRAAAASVRNEIAGMPAPSDVAAALAARF